MRLNPRAWWPQSLAGRVTLILVAGLLVAQLAGLVLRLQERSGMLAGAHPHGAMLGPVPLRFVLHTGLTLAVVIVVSLIAVRWIAKPLRELADAANAFAQDIDAPPLPLSGPIEVRRAAEAFNFMQQRLRGLVVERGRALAAVSHDLRTPLTRLRLRAELVDDAELQRKLDADIATMQAMVNSLLAYFRGLEDAEPVQAIDIEALLQSVVEDECALGRAVRFAEPAPGQPAPAPCAGRLSVLRRAVANLVDNAVAHGRTVTLGLHDAPLVLRILVDDDGPGIPEADLVRVTEPFVRLDAARRLDTGGVGLGLAIVRDAAAVHGGRLMLENRPEGGLRASLVLPRAPMPQRPGAAR